MTEQPKTPADRWTDQLRARAEHLADCTSTARDNAEWYAQRTPKHTPERTAGLAAARDARAAWYVAGAAAAQATHADEWTPERMEAILGAVTSAYKDATRAAGRAAIAYAAHHPEDASAQAHAALSAQENPQ